MFTNGGHHATVAFAYDDDYVYVETGWGYVGKVVWEMFQCYGSDDYQPNAMSLTFNLSHSHSDNYIASDGFYCSCGEKLDSAGLQFSDLDLPGSVLGYAKEISVLAGQNEVDVSYSRAYQNGSVLTLRAENNSSAVFRIDYGLNPIEAIYFRISFAGYSSYIPDILVRTENSDKEWLDYEEISLSYSDSSRYAYIRFDSSCYGVEINITNSGSTPSLFNLTQPIWKEA